MATFIDFLHMCAENRELLREFDRLRGTNLSLKGAPIDLAMDRATGRLEHDAGLFFEFVVDMWSRVPKDAKS
jgi:hypothetical protein